MLKITLKLSRTKAPPFIFNLPSNFRLVKYSKVNSVYVLNPNQYQIMECITTRREATELPDEEFYVTIHQLGDSTDIKEIIREIEKENYPDGFPDELDFEVTLSRVSKVKFGNNIGYSYETKNLMHNVPIVNTLVIDPTENYAIVFSRAYSENLDGAESLSETVYGYAIKSLIFKSSMSIPKFLQLRKNEIKKLLSSADNLPTLPQKFQNGLVIADSGAYNVYIYILDEKIKPEEVGVFNEYLFDSKIPSLRSFNKKTQEQIDKFVKEGKAIAISTICRSNGTFSFCLGKPKDAPWIVIDQPNTAFYNGLAIHTVSYTSEEISSWWSK